MTVASPPVLHSDNPRRCGKCPHLWGLAFSQWCDLYQTSPRSAYIKYDVKCRPIRCSQCLKAERTPNDA